MLVNEASAPTIEATLLDITERKCAEQAIGRDHALMRTLLKSIPDAIFFKDRDGKFLGCNPAFEERVGLREHEIVGRTAAEVYPDEYARAIAEEERRVFASGKLLRLEKNLQLSGGLRHEELLLHPMLDEAGATVGLLGVGRDITERRHIEEQLRQTGKMEGIGRLAGGVAHDFNNLLTVILGNISLLRSILRGSDDGADLLVDCEQAAQRASELTNQLLGFARRKPLSLQPLDLNRRVAENAQLLRRIIDPSIRIHVQPEPQPWLIEGDPSQIGQVLMNLCLNARDALIPMGGLIRVETANVTLGETQLRDNVDARVGEFVRLTVADDGSGISTEIRTRIFEPFFTTKPPGKGTGLGLAVVFGIVQQHNGWIECQSQPGIGTCFDVYFPRSREPAAAPVPSTTVVPRKGNETILLVDDEAMIRELGRTILLQQGYRILQAEDGLVALDVFQQYAGEIDLVVLDLTMPNLSGRETFRRLRELDPNVGVLLSSGYSADEFEPGELDGILGFIPKPYRVDELAAAVRAALDRVKPGDSAGDASEIRQEDAKNGSFVYE
jgi:PAS domain S-box-containing protein